MSQESVLYSLEDVQKHGNKRSAWVIIHNEVYDVTKFLDEHPGGSESLLEYAGQDGTQAFEDIAHSDDARELMKKFKIGSFIGGSEPNEVLPTCSPPPLLNREVIVLAASRWRRDQPPPSSNRLKWAIIALAGALVIGLVMKKYMKPG